MYVCPHSAPLGVWVHVCTLLCKKERKTRVNKGRTGTKTCQTLLENAVSRLHNLSRRKNMWFPCKSGGGAGWRRCESKPLIHRGCCQSAALRLCLCVCRTPSLPRRTTQTQFKAYFASAPELPVKSQTSLNILQFNSQSFPYDLKITASVWPSATEQHWGNAL